jgi:hypothetical protein
LGKATFYFEWTFNEDKTTGSVNAFLDYKGDKINAAEHPKNFEYTATENKIVFPKFPYETFENVYRFTVWALVAPIIACVSFGKVHLTPDDFDVSNSYIYTEENKLTMDLFGDIEYLKVPK